MDGLWVLGDVHIVLGCFLGSSLRGFHSSPHSSGQRDAAFLGKSISFGCLSEQGEAQQEEVTLEHISSQLCFHVPRGEAPFVCSCLWSSDEAVAAPVQPCTDLLCRTTAHGKSGLRCMCSVSKAVAPVIFHGVASCIPGAVSHKNWF